MVHLDWDMGRSAPHADALAVLVELTGFAIVIELVGSVIVSRRYHVAGPNARMYA